MSFDLIQWVKEFFYWPAKGAVEGTVQVVFLSPYFILVVICILILEKVIPANRDQKMISVSFLQDAVWFFLEAIFQAVIVVAYAGFLKSVYDHHLGHLTIATIGQWPYGLRFAWGLLLGDLLAWSHHYLKHKVPWFWHFHTVHHSQKELNMFTDFRYHFVEYLISRTVVVIPMLIAAVDFPTIAWFIILKDWYTRLYHSNIKTNFGVLRYVLVNPQSHRIHHSILPQHQDRNFAVLFSFWDFLFKTQYLKFDEYPESGIKDTTFPYEQSARGLSLLITPLRQLIYPFVAIARGIKRHPSPDEESTRPTKD